MAQLDPLLGALVDKKAQELVMAEGRPAALRVDGKLRQVSQRVLNRDQISRLLAELSERIDAASLASGTPAQFNYKIDGGQQFDCRVGEQDGKLTARVSPVALAAATPTAPAKPSPPRPSIDPSAGMAPASPTMPGYAAASATERRAPVRAVAPAKMIPLAPLPALPVQGASIAPVELGPITAIPAPELGPEPAFDMGMGSDDEAAFGMEEPLGLDPTDPAFSSRSFEVETVAPVAPSERPRLKPATVRPVIAAPACGSADGIERLLRMMAEQGASDLHLASTEPPMLRLHGDMLRVPDAGPISPSAMEALLDPIIPEHNRAEFAETNDTDFAYEIPGVARFRVNFFADRKGRGAVFRLIPTDIKSAEQLGLPEAVMNLCQLPKGLVLVTGPTGSGKSTTLAAMVDHINRSRAEHIITIEDPVEFVHENHKCLVNQREVHSHTQSFKRALRAALREDPDIVLVGELRDLETIAIAIETAETGHLVFGTLHTTTAISTVDRIIDQFPADRQSQIRTMLSESLKGVVAQILLKKIGGGRVAALEVLIVNPAISNLIREGKTFQIPSLMQTGKKQGMRLLNDALIELVKNKLVEPEEAFRKAIDKSGFAGLLRTANIPLNLTPEN